MARTREKEASRTLEPVEGSVAPPAEDEAPTTESDPQELEFLKPREGRVMSAELVEYESRELRKELAQYDADRGAASHRLGRRLHGLYTGFAERREGVATFVGFVQSRFGIGRTRCLDAIRLSVTTTEAQARRYGLSRAILGLRLLELTGLETFKALENHPLDVGLDEPIFFPASVRHLQQAINVLKEQSRPALSRTQVARLTRLNEGLTEKHSAQPALAGTRLGFVYDDQGEPVLEVSGRLDRDARAALAKILGQLVREERSH